MKRYVIPLTVIIALVSVIVFDQLNRQVVPPSKIDYTAGESIYFNKVKSLPDFERNAIQKAEPLMDMVDVVEKWENKMVQPNQWGEKVTGVMNQMETTDKVIALTFDACGGPYGNGYDEKLIEFLRAEEISATLFFNARWIKENTEIFLELSKDPLFDIENHGTNHLPLSVNGGTAWGINATTSIEEVVDEVVGNQQLIHSLTGENPRFFRSGTAFYDEIAVQIVNDLGLTVVNYDILGDAGATFTSDQVRNALLSAKPGSIALLHMNQPSSGTARGVMEAIPELRKQGFTFVTLSDYPLRP